MNFSHTNSFGRAAEALLFLLCLSIWGAATGHRSEGIAQEKERPNPVRSDPEAINLGRSLFRGNCAWCHGMDARGGRGPDLLSGSGQVGDSEAGLFATISKGIPGTEMPGAGLLESEVWMIVTFLRSLTATPQAALTGDREAGRKFFFGEGLCSECHMVRGKGGRFGPELSRIGASRSPSHLIESIRQPSKEIRGAYETVNLLTKEGRRLSGVRKNEDTFSLQLMDQEEAIHLFMKKDLREVNPERKSLMPTYDERMLSEKQLQDLLAYLMSLR